MIPPLNIPESEIKIIRHENHLKIFDFLRKKYVELTPEEYVRQRFTSWLVNQKGYPSSIMANEVGIQLNGTKKRCDTVLFKPDGVPLMIVEYKSPDVVITQEVFDQIVRYNMTLKASCLCISNGIQHYCCLIDYKNKSYSFLQEIPSYKELIGMTVSL